LSAAALHQESPVRACVYAHRGGAALRPENTLAAFDHGLALGADGLEFDVHLSRDGVVVVHHDGTLDRTTNGRGRVSDHTADQLARVDAGYWFRPLDSARGPAAPEFPFRGLGIGVPTLRAVLRRYADARLIIELKVSDGELARRTIDEVRAADAIDRVALGSFSGHALRTARAYDSRIRTGAAKGETRWALYRSRVGWPLGRPTYREFQVPERSGATTIVTRRFIASAHRAGLLVKVWTVNEEADMRRLLAWGADALISDRPDLAVAVVQETPRRDGPQTPVPTQ
jgi:glycerophosphoryl diester phosphodiesterase